MKTLIAGRDTINRVSTILSLEVLMILFLTFPMLSVSQTVSNTYSAGDISTSLPPFNPTCNGPVTTLTVNLPAGGPWVVTGIDIVYDMLAQSTGWKSHQRSQVYCQNTERIEASVYSGTGDANGVMSYSRTNVSIANGPFVGGTSLLFEMRAWRTTGGTGCNTTYNRVNNFTWMITVHYTMLVEDGSVGIGTSSPDPSAVLDLSAATKGLLPPRMNTALRLAIEDPAAGLLVYDSDADKLYSYSGSSWEQINPDFMSIIRDNDNDTKIQVEQSVDEDKIRFDVGGTERWIMEETRLKTVNSGNSLFIGEDAGMNDDLSSNDNIAIGNFSSYYNSNGISNTGLGRYSLFRNTSGSDNVAVGHSSGYGDSGEDFDQCTFVGAFSSLNDPRTNVTMLGYGITNSLCTGDNQVLLGNTAITSIRAEVTGITAYSDARYKMNITEDIKGLDFIKRLRPVSYNVRPTELHKIWGTPDSLYQRIDHSDVEQMRFSGFLAQEVERAAVESDYAFTGIDVPKNETETYALRYTEFIVPLVKAMQELQTEVEELKREIELLKVDRQP